MGLGLMLSGFEPKYEPPDVAITDIVDLQKALESLSETIAIHREDAADIKDIVETLQDEIDSLVKEIGATLPGSKNVVVQGQSVTIPSPQEYITLLSGSPSFEEVRAMNAYEAHHLGPEGNIDVFSYADAVSIRDDMNSFYGDDDVKKVVESIVTKSSDTPPFVTDYMFHKVNNISRAIGSIADSFNATRINSFVDISDKQRLAEAWEMAEGILIDVFIQECLESKTLVNTILAVERIYNLYISIQSASKIHITSKDRWRYLEGLAKKALLNSAINSTLGKKVLGVLNEVEKGISSDEGSGAIKFLVSRAISNSIGSTTNSVLEKVYFSQRELVNYIAEENAKFDAIVEKETAIKNQKLVNRNITSLSSVSSILDKFIAEYDKVKNDSSIKDSSTIKYLVRDTLFEMSRVLQ